MKYEYFFHKDEDEETEEVQNQQSMEIKAYREGKNGLPNSNEDYKYWYDLGRNQTHHME